ncbi:MAG: hypothetical protein KC912_11525 [Proteobacteria bacterium]|nr:hypothetical protein [Pseudomonadota bacterium]
MRWLPLVFLFACTVGASVNEDDPADSGDTGSTTDTGGTDTGEPKVYGPPKSIEVRYTDTAGSNWRVAAWLTHFDDNGFVWIREHTSVATSASPQTVEVPLPGGSDLVDFGDGVGNAFWFLFTYDDRDGSGTWTAGDPIPSSGARMLGYIEESQGQQDVWYAMAFTDTDTEYFAAEEGFDLTALNGAPDITLAGTTNWQGGPQGQPDRIATFTSDEFEGTIVPNRPLDEPLNTPFTYTITGGVHPSRTVTDQGFTYGIEIPLGYVDADASGGFNAGDEIATTLCAAGNPVYLFWSAPPATVEAATTAGLYDLKSGWSAYASTATEELLLTDTTGLTLSPTDCSFN